MLSFDELTKARRLLQNFCKLHERSLLRLQSGISCRLFPTERELGSERVRHLTTTATCLSSLYDCPEGYRSPEFARVEALRSAFAEKAPLRNWISEGSAGIYCRCRALPMVISSSATIRGDVWNHVGAILIQLKRR